MDNSLLLLYALFILAILLVVVLFLFKDDNEQNIKPSHEDTFINDTKEYVEMLIEDKKETYNKNIKLISSSFDVNKLELILYYNEVNEEYFKSKDFIIKTKCVYQNWFSEHLTGKLKITVNSINFDTEENKVIITFKDELIPLKFESVSKAILENEVIEKFGNIKTFEDFYNYETVHGWSTYDKQYNANSKICLRSSKRKPIELVDISFTSVQLDYVPKNLYKRICEDTKYGDIKNFTNHQWLLKHLAQCEDLNNPDLLLKTIEKLSKEKILKLLECYPFYTDDDY